MKVFKRGIWVIQLDLLILTTKKIMSMCNFEILTRVTLYLDNFIMFFLCIDIINLNNSWNFQSGTSSSFFSSNFYSIDNARESRQMMP